MSRSYSLLVMWLISLAITYYVYHGYLLVLRTLAWMTGRAGTELLQGPLPSVTLLLTVHNEQRRIGEKLQNLLELEYDRTQLEILVASDGSTDRTNDLIREQSARGAPIRLLAFDRVGKSEAQNRAIAQARGEIVVFTDADCMLAVDFLRELVRPFADKRVGCVTGSLSMRSGENVIARSQGYYWNYEIALRELESKLGILAVASGQAMAVRRSAFVPIPADVGEDCMIPLDTVLQGLKAVHAASAHASDSMVSDVQGEFRTRVRMTLRNWNGTWRRAALLNPIRHPGYAFALWSHKVLRWLSPAFLLTGSFISLAFFNDPVLWPAPILVLAFFALAGLGWINQVTGIGLPIAGTAYSFCLANLGFLVGVAKALTGHTIVSYCKTVDEL